MNHTAFFEPEHRTMAADAGIVPHDGGGCRTGAGGEGYGTGSGPAAGFQAAWNLDQARREAASGAASAEGGGRVGSTISVSELGRFSVCLGLQFH